MLVDELVLEQFLALQRRAIKTNLLFAGLVIVVGLSFIGYVWSSLSIVTSDIKTLSSIGGVLVSSLSGFRFNEVMQRRERIVVIRSFQLRLKSVEGTELSESERQRLEEVLWRIAEKSLTG